MWNTTSYGSHMFGADGMGWGWFAGFHGIFGLLVMTLVIVGLFYLVRSISGVDGAHVEGPTVHPRSALELRYAKGEIDREEYLRRKHDLDTA